MTDLQEALSDFRRVRDELERSLLPLATSVDGRRFGFQVSLHDLELELGGYLALEQDGSTRLGQVLSLEARHEVVALPGGTEQIRIRAAAGEGIVLHGDGRPFHDARLRLAAPEEVRAWLEETTPDRAQLDVGELALARDVPFRLDAGGFGRHTFLCGQSGSGKTYSLGVLLERLLVETELRVVILDPNSDYVRLGEPRADDERYRGAAAGVSVRTGAEGRDAIRIRFRGLSPSLQAATLNLDPLRDRTEYGQLLSLVEDESVRSVADFTSAVGGDELGHRVRNLGIDGFGIWPRSDETSVLDELVGSSKPRCLVVDLGSLGTRDEQTLVSAAVLERLWRERARREPVAIVIDEAHNVCPSAPEGPLSALATETAIRIAGEGRKFGLYLIVVTQRPQKVHENVLSQCDNLVLMRMNSLTDLGHVREIFSFVPTGLVEDAVSFRQGEALVAGKIASHPAIIRFGARMSHEGGADVGGWA